MAVNIEGVPGLLKDIEFSFGLPILVFAMAMINIKFSNYRSDMLMHRLSLSCCLLLFITCFSFVMSQDRSVLIALWRTSPAGYSFLYAAGMAIIMGIFAFLVQRKLRPTLWSIRSSKSNV
jgi:hypothetical protein